MTRWTWLEPYTGWLFLATLLFNLRAAWKLDVREGFFDVRVPDVRSRDVRLCAVRSCALRPRDVSSCD